MFIVWQVEDVYTLCPLFDMKELLIVCSLFDS